MILLYGRRLEISNKYHPTIWQKSILLRFLSSVQIFPFENEITAKYMI